MERHHDIFYITSELARFRDPQTGIPYANFKQIQRIRSGQLRWSSLLEAYGGPGDDAAKGFPDGLCKVQQKREELQLALDINEADIRFTPTVYILCPSPERIMDPLAAHATTFPLRMELGDHEEPPGNPGGFRTRQVYPPVPARGKQRIFGTQERRHSHVVINRLMSEDMEMQNGQVHLSDMGGCRVYEERFTMGRSIGSSATGTGSETLQLESDSKYPPDTCVSQNANQRTRRQLRAAAIFYDGRHNVQPSDSDYEDLLSELQIIADEVIGPLRCLVSSILGLKQPNRNQRKNCGNTRNLGHLLWFKRDIWAYEAFPGQQLEESFTRSSGCTSGTVNGVCLDTNLSCSLFPTETDFVTQEWVIIGEGGDPMSNAGDSGGFEITKRGKMAMVAGMIIGGVRKHTIGSRAEQIIVNNITVVRPAKSPD
ncbi:hypothetical protein BGX38DRAFT_1332385 [Terfezia claveryi]|nr:hypothetical protein BGX38DRAFT_1332385 [Terfezia claveryi]